MAITLCESAHAGLKHVALGLGLLAGVAVYANHSAELMAFMGHEQSTMPHRIVTDGEKQARCTARALETVFGKVGCGASREAGHRSKTQLRMAGQAHLLSPPRRVGTSSAAKP